MMIPGNRQAKTLTLAAALSALAVGLPFLNKPIHIDDPFVLVIAEQIRHDPFRPFGHPGNETVLFNWFHDPEPLFNIATNPPFLSYWIAPVLAVFGPSEIALHLAMLPFLILMAFAVAALSRRFAQGSIWPVLFVMFSPAVVVSPNVMRDVPAAALATGAVALFVAGTDRDRWSHVILASILAGLAMVTKYSALIMLPVLAVYPILTRKPRYLAGLLAALAILGLLYLQNWLVHGKVHFFVMRSKEQAYLHLTNMMTAALVITGASFFVVPALLVQSLRRRHWVIALGAIVAAIATVLSLRKLYPGAGNAQYYLWAILGAMLIFSMVAAGLFASGRWWTRPRDPESLDSLFLLWWLAGPYSCGILFVEFPAVRHILPAAAPIVLLAVRYCQRSLASPNRWTAAAFGAGLALQALIAYWAAAADYQCADTYRSHARVAANELKVPQGNQIWFQGHWSWQHYALAAGFRQLAEHGPDFPRPGDLILEPQFVHKGNLPAGLRERLELIAEKRYPARLGAVTMDGWGKASFYSTSGTTSPFYFATGQTYDVFRIYRVRPQ